MYQKIAFFWQIFLCTLGYLSATGNASQAQLMSQGFTLPTDRDSSTKVVRLPRFIRLDSKQFLDQICKINLTFNGKGGIPPAPDLPLDSRNITIQGQNTNSVFTISEPLNTSWDKIKPARGVKVTESGGVVLTAYRTDNSQERIPEGSANCGV